MWACKSQQGLIENGQYFLVAAATASSKATIHQLKASSTEISANTSIQTAYLVFIPYENNESSTSHFFLFSPNRQKQHWKHHSVRPHVGSTTTTNKHWLLNPLVLTCWYEQLQILNWGPYVQDVLILNKPHSLLNQQVLITITAGFLCAN